mmetsp:Transcript_287/g.987  ORF Transcript_287/g.987 Transcript_287/m.987 type:complete len:260 (-) Transcript_287:93-872(-)
MDCLFPLTAAGVGPAGRRLLRPEVRRRLLRGPVLPGLARPPRPDPLRGGDRRRLPAAGGGVGPARPGAPEACVRDHVGDLRPVPGPSEPHGDRPLPGQCQLRAGGQADGDRAHPAAAERLRDRRPPALGAPRRPPAGHPRLRPRDGAPCTARLLPLRQPPRDRLVVALSDHGGGEPALAVALQGRLGLPVRDAGPPPGLVQRHGAHRGDGSAQHSYLPHALRVVPPRGGNQGKDSRLSRQPWPASRRHIFPTTTKRDGN